VKNVNQAETGENAADEMNPEVEHSKDEVMRDDCQWHIRI